LLLAVGSPVAPVEEHDPPITRQVAWETQGPTADLVHLERWKTITRIEHLVGHPWHAPSSPGKIRRATLTGHAGC
jgi:hypothetical protein